MNAIEMLSELESVSFTTDQARAITRILESRHGEAASKEDLHKIIHEFKGLENKFGGLRDEFGGLRDEFGGLRDEFKELRSEFKGMDNRVKQLENKMATKDDLKELEDKMATRDGMRAEILSSKYDLVKWIAGGLIANGLLNLLIKYYG
ncbi:MAG: hypothetical protein GDA51_04380 [Ekhidna sp.]|nr:hypothetical protein [Ekhidna sp.]MBC6425704.1 hypothetical protein [Ekhidna sp.]